MDRPQQRKQSEVTERHLPSYEDDSATLGRRKHKITYTPCSGAIRYEDIIFMIYFQTQGDNSSAPLNTPH